MTTRRPPYVPSDPYEEKRLADKTDEFDAHMREFRADALKHAPAPPPRSPITTKAEATAWIAANDAALESIAVHTAPEVMAAHVTRALAPKRTRKPKPNGNDDQQKAAADQRLHAEPAPPPKPQLVTPPALAQTVRFLRDVYSAAVIRAALDEAGFLCWGNGHAPQGNRRAAWIAAATMAAITAAGLAFRAWIGVPR